jgi:hypothetical protein
MKATYKVHYFLLVLGSIFLPASAFAATLQLTPTTGTYAVGDTFSVGVYLNMEGEETVGVDLEMTYPPALLEVPGGSIVPGTLMPQLQLNRVEGNKIRFAQLVPALPYYTNTQPELYATIPFRVIGSGSAPVTILFTPGNTRDSNVAKIGGIDLLTGVSNATFTLLTADGKMAAQEVSYTFARSLTIGGTGEDVRQLQKFLNAQGFTLASFGPGSPGSETDYFGPITRAAVIKFQEAYTAEVLAPVGLTRGTGYFGPSTRAKAHALMSSGGASGQPQTVQNLQLQIQQLQEQVERLLLQLLLQQLQTAQ